MRLFIAVMLNKEFRDAVATAQDRLRRLGIRGNYSKAENLHITLAFIGEYDDPDAVLDVMKTVRLKPVTLRSSALGSFGGAWWLGLEDTVPICDYVKRLRTALERDGIPFDKKRFSPHITIIREPSKDEIPAVNVPSASMYTGRISLMKSERGARGVIYTELGAVE